MALVPKDLNENNRGYGNKIASHAWQASMSLLFGGGGFPGLAEYFESGNYQKVIQGAKEHLRGYMSTDKISSMSEFELATFYLLGETYYELGEIETATGCFHVVLSQKKFINHMLTNPVYFPDYVEKAEERLNEIAKTKGDDFVTNYDIVSFFTNIKRESGCFIATATFGSPFAPEVIALRRYRDDVLNHSILGRLFIRAYYFISPSIASMISSSEILRTGSRNVLNRIIILIHWRNTR
jgi:hypothetical protein